MDIDCALKVLCYVMILLQALGQFCAQVNTLSAITHTQNAPVEL